MISKILVNVLVFAFVALFGLALGALVVANNVLYQKRMRK